MNLATTKVCDFTRHAIALMQAKGDPMVATEIAAARWPQKQLVAAVIKGMYDPRFKAAVAIGSPTTWGAALAPSVLDAPAFIEYLRPATVLGRMAGMRPVPFNITAPRQTSGATMQWAGAGRPKTATSVSFDTATLGVAKFGGIVVLSDELVRSSEAEPLIQNDLIAASAQFADQQLLDPDAIAVADVSPASITSGAPSFASSGADAAAVEGDLKLLVGSLNANGIRFRSPYFVMLPRTALHLATLRATDGTRIFHDVGVKGGFIWGIPVLVTANLPMTTDSAAVSIIVLLDAAEILLADGGIEIDASSNASLQMVTDPGTGAQSLVSLWATNSVGLRVERYQNWTPAHEGMAAVLSGVGY